jgi:predicted adenylyl cyclase CyaB
MNIKELEIKSWVYEENKKDVLTFLKNNTKYERSIIKKDVIYSKDKKNQVDFRIREINNEVFVTRKNRDFSINGAEINDEIEFEINDKNEFIKFMENLGYLELYKKEKKIDQYYYNSALIEYVEIENLGFFLEVEILSKEDKLKENENKILDILKLCKLEKNIEKKPYFLLLNYGLK